MHTLGLLHTGDLHVNFYLPPTEIEFYDLETHTRMDISLYFSWSKLPFKLFWAVEASHVISLLCCFIVQLFDCF